MMKRVIAFLMAALFCLWNGQTAFATPDDTVQQAVESAGRYLDTQKPGTWSILAHSLHQLEFPKKSISNLELDVAGHKEGGYRYLKDLETAVINAVAAGKRPESVEGADLIAMLASHPDISAQGLDGAAGALLAIDALGSDLPEGASWTRQSAVQTILYFQREDGGFGSAAGAAADPRSTALALTALAPYREQEGVRSAAENAVQWLSAAQNQDGSFSDLSGIKSCESTAAVLTAVCAWGISPDDSSFQKSQGLVQALLSFQGDKGGFSPSPGQGADVAATEQALIALRALQSGSSPYDFTSSFKPEKVKSLGETMASFFSITFGVVALIYLALLFTRKVGERFGKPSPSPAASDPVQPDSVQEDRGSAQDDSSAKQDKNGLE